MTDLAIYDMDRTVTRRATYTPFLLHCAWRLEPWRLLLLPVVAGSMLAYVAKQQPMIDFLQPSAIDDLRHVGQHRPRHHRQQQQPPRLEPPRAI